MFVLFVDIKSIIARLYDSAVVLHRSVCKPCQPLAPKNLSRLYEGRLQITIIRLARFADLCRPVAPGTTLLFFFAQ